MWWNRVILGWSGYHVVLWFLAYSILGWAVESIYMSICNQKLTNRGFTKTPLCPIYGVGALTVFFSLGSYSERPIQLFFMGMFLATALEFLTAIVMKRIFDEIWWDYNEKRMNYRGIICVESSIAWGFYTVALFAFLQNIIVSIVDKIPVMAGKIIGSIIILIYTVDFVVTLYKRKKEAIPDRIWEVRDWIVRRMTVGR